MRAFSAIDTACQEQLELAVGLYMENLKKCLVLFIVSPDAAVQTQKDGWSVVSLKCFPMAVNPALAWRGGQMLV